MPAAIVQIGAYVSAICIAVMAYAPLVGIIVLTIFGHATLLVILRMTGWAWLLRSCYIYAVSVAASVSVPIAFLLFLLGVAGHASDGFPGASAVVAVYAGAWLLTVASHVLAMVVKSPGVARLFGTVGVIGYCFTLCGYVTGAEGRELAIGESVWFSSSHCLALWIPLQLLSICVIGLAWNSGR